MVHIKKKKHIENLKTTTTKKPDPPLNFLQFPSPDENLSRIRQVSGGNWVCMSGEKSQPECQAPRVIMWVSCWPGAGRRADLRMTESSFKRSQQIKGSSESTRWTQWETQKLKLTVPACELSVAARSALCTLQFISSLQWSGEEGFYSPIFLKQGDWGVEVQRTVHTP